MIIYAEEPYYLIVNELKGIVQSQWDELGEDQYKIKLSPRYDDYAALDEQGSLAMFTARHLGKIVGYSVILLYPHRHHKDRIFADSDLIFVKKEYRNKRIGYRLIKMAETWLRDIGIDYITYNFKAHLPYGHGITKLGYVHIENVYGKYLGE